MAHDVFISYSAKDKAVADTICATLESGGVKCWIAPRDIGMGSYGAAIIKAISSCRMVILVLSSISNNSKQVIKEIERAVSKGKDIYPVRIEEVLPSVELELFISSEHWLDAFTPPLEDHLKRLAANVKSQLNISGESTGTAATLPQTHFTSARAQSTRSPRTLQVLIVAGVIVGLLIGVALLRNRQASAPAAASNSSANVATVGTPPLTPSPSPSIKRQAGNTSPQGSPSPAPPVNQNSPPLPVRADGLWMNGTWRGTAYQMNSNTTWSVVLTGYYNTYTIEYPSLSCKGALNLIRMETAKAEFNENILNGTCVDNGRVVLEKINDTQISFKYSRPGVSTVTSSATLNKTQ